MAYVYRHTRIDTGQPFYIGIGNVEYSKKGQVWYQRAFTKSDRSPYWKNIANKTAIEIEIMIDGLTYDEAKQKEIEFIKLYKRVKDGGTLVNLTDGGDGAVGQVVGEATRKKISAIHKGKTSHLKGTKLSEEHRARLSAAGKGRPSHRKGKKMTAEHSQKIKDAIKKNGHPGQGKPMPENVKRAIIEANTGKTPVLQFKDGILVNEYNSLVTAASITGFKKGSINSAVKGYLQTYKGYVWRYKEPDITH